MKLMRHVISTLCAVLLLLCSNAHSDYKNYNQAAECPCFDLWVDIVARTSCTQDHWLGMGQKIWFTHWYEEDLDKWNWIGTVNLEAHDNVCGYYEGIRVNPILYTDIPLHSERERQGCQNLVYELWLEILELPSCP